MDLIKIYMKLEGIAEHEWKNMHHNATLNGKGYPDFESEALSSEFWEFWLGNHVRILIDDLQYYIEEVYGFDLKFYSYGRSGATIAPDEWGGPAPGNSRGPWNKTSWDDRDPSDEDSIEDQKYVYREVVENNINIIKCMRYINSYWKAEAEAVPSAWKEYCRDKYGDNEECMKFYKESQITVRRINNDKKDEKGFKKADAALLLYRSFNSINSIDGKLSKDSKAKLTRIKNQIMRVVETEGLEKYFEALEA